MDASNRARHLTRALRTLAPRALTDDELAGVAGAGETASTSTSGTPAAGDDTEGDASGGGGGGLYPRAYRLSIDPID